MKLNCNLSFHIPESQPGINLFCQVPNQGTLTLLTFFCCTLLFSACRFTEQTPAISDCAVTSKMRTVPSSLSASCLYSDISRFRVSPQLQKFTPNYQLWSDASNKSRWIYLPAGSKINTDNPDRWIFPVGTQIFKEFRQYTRDGKTELRVETRHLQKITPGEGLDSWLISTYLWNTQQTDAFLSEGASNVLNTDHDIPSEQDCIDCHKGNSDLVLGFDAIQLSDAQEKNAFGFGDKRQTGEWTLKRLLDASKLTQMMDLPRLPGSPLDQKALGYLHANCGNCHNPIGLAAEQEAKHLKFRHRLAFKHLQETDVYRTAVNQKTQNFTAVPYIILGAEQDELALYQSAVFIRMNSTDENYRMPMLAREKVDYQALELFQRWFKTLATPAQVNFDKDHRKLPKATSTTTKKRDKPLAGPGLQVEIQFLNDQNIPPVLALYWPEDKSLNAQPIMDHQDGFFTQKLLLGNQGSMMSLRNSDDVGHTIYVNDKKHKIKWQLSYMPPGSSFEQELFWQEDIFVEMKCRLHLYMSAWVGSIHSKYYKIVELGNTEQYKTFSMSGYPEEFQQVKIWLPKFDLIETRIGIGQQQSFDLKQNGQQAGKIRIKRSKQ